MEKLRAAVNEFDNFQALMRKSNRYDFDDMINWVIKAFEENKNLLRRYQEKYQYILVDEYQDTSGTQNQLVELLINYWDNPNVFVVGDDDQSIYRFQGANGIICWTSPAAICKDLQIVVLTNNYRSTQPILDISKTLIGRNAGRLIYRMPGTFKGSGFLESENLPYRRSPLIREYETERAEMISIVSQIEHLITRGIQPGKIAVIYKENKYGQELLPISN